MAPSPCRTDAGWETDCSLPDFGATDDAAAVAGVKGREPSADVRGNPVETCDLGHAAADSKRDADRGLIAGSSR